MTDSPDSYQSMPMMYWYFENEDYWEANQDELEQAYIYLFGQERDWRQWDAGRALALGQYARFRTEGQPVSFPRRPNGEGKLVQIKETKET